MGGKPEASAALKESSEGCGASEPRALAPWLLKRYEDQERYEDQDIVKIDYAFFNFFEQKNESLREFIPELSSTTFYQKPSHQGWLIVLCDDDTIDYSPSSRNYGDCFLWNPITNNTIELPTLLEFYKGNYRFWDCVLSSPPPTEANINSDSNNNNDSVVLFFGSNRNEEANGYTFVFCRPGETQWRIHKLSPDVADLLPLGRPKSLLCFKGKFYLLCADSNNVDEHHLEIELFKKGTDLDISIKSVHVKKEGFPIIGKASVKFCYVESHDELFRVDIIISRGSVDVISIKVVRLNFSIMEWEKVNNIGDHVLFVGSQNTTACCSAVELGLSSGCLYYLHWSGKRSVYKFEIESTRNTVALQCVWPREKFSFTDWIIMPLNMHGRVENVIGGKDEENGLLTALGTNATSTTIVYDEKQNGNCNAGEEEVANSWNDFNGDVLGLIANRLHGSDYKNIRSLCKANRQLIPKVQKTSYLSPWMVFCRDHNNTTFNVMNPMYNDENYLMNVSEAAGSTIRFQKDGWLLITRNHDIFFYNPFTRETVKLPDMDRDNYFSVVSFSSLPTSSDCIVFALDERGDGNYIDFIRRGETHWSSHTFDSITIGSYVPFLDTAFFRDEAFYCVDHHGNIGVFSTRDKSWKVEPREIVIFHDDSPGFLVECGGDLLLVKLEYDKEPIRIFRLNFSDMEWAKVESLEEHVLFISQTSCVSAVAPVDYMKNKIYFPRLYRNGGRIVFYSFETCSYHTLGSEHSAKDLHDTEGWLENCTWIEPNRLKSSTEGLDWFKIPF